jgi:hypothetical protein
MIRMTRSQLSLIGLLAVLLTLSIWHVRAASLETRSGPGTTRMPVLIELFTSEGCSSCPPADSLLQKLDRAQPVPDADLIVLSEHVDYWDDIGWKDPYSSHEYSARQDAYAKRFDLDSVYTPQMVVDGQTQFVGSDERTAIQLIERAAKTEKIPVALSSIHRQGADLIAHVEAGPLLSSTGPQSAGVWVALADDSDQSSVARGENAGRTLKHVAVVRNLTQVGTIPATGKFSQDVKLSIGNANPQNLRVVAIAQVTPVGRVLGVGSARLPD